MPLINDIYVWCKSENYATKVTLPTHPVEDGIDIIDQVSRSAETLKISGRIVGEDADDVIDTLTGWEYEAKPVVYDGKRSFQNALLSDFQYTGTKVDGYDFSATITEVRYAGQNPKPTERGSQPTKGTTDKGKQQLSREVSKDKAVTSEKPTTYKVKNGDSGIGISQKTGASLDTLKKYSPYTSAQVSTIVQSTANELRNQPEYILQYNENTRMIYDANTYQIVGFDGPPRSGYTQRR